MHPAKRVLICMYVLCSSTCLFTSLFVRFSTVGLPPFVFVMTVSLCVERRLGLHLFVLSFIIYVVMLDTCYDDVLPPLGLHWRRCSVLIVILDFTLFCWTLVATTVLPPLLFVLTTMLYVERLLGLYVVLLDTRCDSCIAAVGVCTDDDALFWTSSWTLPSIVRCLLFIIFHFALMRPFTVETGLRIIHFCVLWLYFLNYNYHLHCYHGVGTRCFFYTD